MNLWILLLKESLSLEFFRDIIWLNSQLISCKLYKKKKRKAIFLVSVSFSSSLKPYPVLEFGFAFSLVPTSCWVIYESIVWHVIFNHFIQGFYCYILLLVSCNNSKFFIPWFKFCFDHLTWWSLCSLQLGQVTWKLRWYMRDLAESKWHGRYIFTTNVASTLWTSVYMPKPSQMTLVKIPSVGATHKYLM